MEKKFNIMVAGAVVIVCFLGVLGCGIAYFTLYRALRVQHEQLADIQARIGPAQTRVQSPRNIPAAPDSIEGQMRSQGKHWVRASGEITVGAYVQDLVEGRGDQPQGRGSIGKVLSMALMEGGSTAAQVDFGRGYIESLNITELSLIRFVPEAP